MHAVAQLVEALRYKRKVAGSIADGVTGIFNLHYPSGRIMALGPVSRADNFAIFMC